MLEWLNNLMGKVADFCPRLVTLRSTHHAVVWRWGGRTPVVYTRGPVPHWPIIEDYEHYPVVRQTTDLRSQTISTRDGRTFGVGGLAVFEIDDIRAFLTACYDGEDVITDLALYAITEVVSDVDGASLLGETRDVSAKVSSILRKRAAHYGVRIRRVSFTDLCEIKYPLSVWNAKE